MSASSERFSLVQGRYFGEISCLAVPLSCSECQGWPSTPVSKTGGLSSSDEHPLPSLELECYPEVMNDSDHYKAAGLNTWFSWLFVIVARFLLCPWSSLDVSILTFGTPGIKPSWGCPFVCYFFMCYTEVFQGKKSDAWLRSFQIFWEIWGQRSLTLVVRWWNKVSAFIQELVLHFALSKRLSTHR